MVKERDMSRTPLFQVAFGLQNIPDVEQLDFGQVQLSGEAFAHDSAKFDIAFYVKETVNGLQGSVEYSTDLYREQRVGQMTVHFKQLLQSIVAEPRQKTGKLQMLSAVEEQQLLVEFNDSSADYPRDKTIVQLFEEQALKTPGATAVVLFRQSVIKNCQLF